MCKMAEKSHGKSMVGYERRFAVSFNKAYELLHTGVIGDLLHFKAYAYSSDFLSLNPSKIEKASASRGGLLRDLCSHAIDLSVWFFGDLKLKTKRIDSSESLSIDVTTSDSVVGSVDASWAKLDYRLPEIGLELIGEKGSIKVNDDQVLFTDITGLSKKWYRLDLKDNVDFLLGAPEYYRESKHFIDSIAAQLEPEPNFKTAFKTEQVIDQVKNIG
jgi:predicted dehydrogenase